MPPENEDEESNCVSNTVVVVEPRAKLAAVRERTGGEIIDGGGGSHSHEGAPANYDVEQNVREIQAILVTNAEIFDRCMERRAKHTTPGDTTSFERFSYEIVEISTVHASETRIATRPGLSRREFDTRPLSKLPDALEDMIVFRNRPEPYSNFIDLEHFFEKSLILHESVLGPFLAALKDHLMKVQVCLGEVDAWLKEPEGNIGFLETMFGEMKPPTFIEKHLPFWEDERYDYGEPIEFVCGEIQTLKLWKGGKMEMKFEISKEVERKRLTKLLEFMEIE